MFLKDGWNWLAPFHSGSSRLIFVQLGSFFELPCLMMRTASHHPFWPWCWYVLDAQDINFRNGSWKHMSKTKIFPFRTGCPEGCSKLRALGRNENMFTVNASDLGWSENWIQDGIPRISRFLIISCFKICWNDMEWLGIDIYWHKLVYHPSLSLFWAFHQTQIHFECLLNSPVAEPVVRCSCSPEAGGERYRWSWGHGEPMCIVITTKIELWHPTRIVTHLMHER